MRRVRLNRARPRLRRIPWILRRFRSAFVTGAGTLRGFSLFFTTLRLCRPRCNASALVSCWRFTFFHSVWSFLVNPLRPRRVRSRLFKR